jgi:hypothetical protein
MAVFKALLVIFAIWMGYLLIFDHSGESHGALPTGEEKAQVVEAAKGQSPITAESTEPKTDAPSSVPSSAPSDPKPLATQQPTSKLEQSPPSQTDVVPLFGAAFSQKLQGNGLDVLVVGDRDTLIFDCTKELDPRTTCFALYLAYPPYGELQALQLMGIRFLKFRTEPGFFSGFTWEKEIQ